MNIFLIGYRCKVMSSNVFKLGTSCTQHISNACLVHSSNFRSGHLSFNKLIIEDAEELYFMVSIYSYPLTIGAISYAHSLDI